MRTIFFKLSSANKNEIYLFLIVFRTSADIGCPSAADMDESCDSDESSDSDDDPDAFRDDAADASLDFHDDDPDAAAAFPDGADCDSYRMSDPAAAFLDDDPDDGPAGCHAAFRDDDPDAGAGAGSPGSAADSHDDDPDDDINGPDCDSYRISDPAADESDDNLDGCHFFCDAGAAAAAVADNCNAAFRDDGTEIDSAADDGSANFSILLLYVLFINLFIIITKYIYYNITLNYLSKIKQFICNISFIVFVILIIN